MEHKFQHKSLLLVDGYSILSLPITIQQFNVSSYLEVRKHIDSNKRGSVNVNLTLRRIRTTIVAVKNNKFYIF